MLTFEFNSYTTNETKPYQRYYYDQGNYEAMREDLNIDWAETLNPYTHDLEKQWDIFTDILNVTREKNVPRKIITGIKPKRKGTPIDRRTFQATKKKQRAWQRYIES